MKVVGINIEPGRIAVAEVQRQLGRTALLDSVVLSYATEDELVAQLRERAAAWAGARIVSAVPGRLLTQRVLTLPFSDRKRLEKALPFELEDALPFSLDDVVLGHLVLGLAGEGKNAETRVLALMLPKAELRRHLDLLGRAGIDPQSVVPSFAGLASLVPMIPAAGGRLLIAGREACLAEGGAVQALRSVGDAPTGGLRHVLQSFEASRKERVDAAVLLAGDGGAKEALSALGLAVEEIVPELAGKRPADPLALGIALADEGNLRSGEFAFQRFDEGARKRRTTIIIAAAVTAVIFAVNVAVKFSIVESGYGKLDKEIKDIYHQTFPDARPPGDAVREMRDRLNDAKKRFGALGSGTSALDVMQAVTDGIPKDLRVSFQDFLLEGDRLRLQGEAPSFESLDRVKAELQKSPLFAGVDVQDTRMGVDNKVKFRLEIKLKQAM